MLTDADIAELLARAAEEAKQPLQRALRRASRRAFLWPVEVEDMFRGGEDLTELSGIGPYVSKLIEQWMSRWQDLVSFDIVELEPRQQT